MTLRFYSVTLAAIDSPPVSFRGDATSSRPYSPIQSTARVSLASPSRVALLATVYKPRATRHGSRCIVHPTPFLLTPLAGNEIEKYTRARFYTSSSAAIVRCSTPFPSYFRVRYSTRFPCFSDLPNTRRN